MIVPTFRITQDAEFVHVHINVPYVRVSAAEMVCDGLDFSFWCKPYLLKLKFPHELDGSDEERCKASYDPMDAHGTLVAHLPKVEPGQHFPDLDLTTKLLQMRLRTGLSSMSSGSSLAAGMNALPARRDGPPGIHVLSSSRDEGGEGEGEGEVDKDDLEIDFETEEDISLKVGTHVFYGFNRRYTQVLGRFREEFVDVLELQEPDTTPEDERRALRVAAENTLFSPDRYLGDSMGAAEDPMFEAAMSYEPFWAKHWTHWRATLAGVKAAKEAGSQDPAGGTAVYAPQAPEAILETTFMHAEGAGGFSEEERTALAQSLSNRELLVSATEQRALLLGLLDLLYAFCFDHRCTQGEPNVESAYNMVRASACMSWLEQYNHRGDGVQVVLCSVMRRACIYPYLRNWKLSRKVLGDVARVLYLGRHSVLKCLLGLRAVLEHTDTHYMLNKVLLDDYCTWVQSSSLHTSTLASFAEEFNTAKTAFEKSASSGKAGVGLQLPELEEWVENGFDSDGNEQDIPSSFNAANRNAATAATVLSPPVLQPKESLLNNIAKPAVLPAHSTLSSMLSVMTVEQQGQEQAVPAAPVKAKPLIQEL